jgi:hypothetical protein
LLLWVLPVGSQAAEPNTSPRFGVALNSNINGEVYPIRLVPSATVLVGRNQLEAGVGVHPFIRTDQRVLSGELNYKFFANGLDTPLSLYLIAHLSYVNNKRETYYPTTYHYLFGNGGYGVQLNAASGMALGTNVTVGPYARIRRSENPYDGFESDGLFDDIGVNLAFQFNLGYRF